jgi:uncharacterized surface anchored protein
MKRNILIPFFFLLLLLLPIEAHALDRSGTITVTVLYEETAVPGGEMTLYQVGSSAIEVGETDDWEKDAQELAQELAENTAYFEGTAQTLDDQGRTVFRHLEEGVYLLVQTKAADGYLAANPFLVTLSAGETVTAYPKVEPVRIEEPDATPTPTPAPTQAATPTPVPPGTGTVTPAPSPSQEPSGTTEPAVSPMPSQQPQPDVSPAEPAVSPEPSEITAVSPEPSEITAVSPAPSVSPTISPEPSPTASGEKKTLTNPFTGDEIDLRFSMALVGVCLIALALVLLTGKRNKHS